MYRIRFHGRGGQGMKTSSRILGTAFFLEGYEIQDAPRYGAERRGAPIFAYVRVSREAIFERGVVDRPDLVVVADASLVSMPAAGVLAGCAPQTVLLVEASGRGPDEGTFAAFDGVLLTIATGTDGTVGGSNAYVSSLWAGAAARLCGAVSKKALTRAVADELHHLGEGAVTRNLETAWAGWEAMAEHSGIVRESDPHPPMSADAPQWVGCTAEPVSVAAPVVRCPETSRNVKTGLWRTARPVIDHSKCGRCWWNCSVYCPDSAIVLNGEGFPVIDDAYCKGCLVCVRQCPRKAIEVLPEGEAAERDKGGRP